MGLLPFKKGAFYLAIEAQVPLFPMVVSSLKDVASWRHGANKGGKVIFRFLDPIPTTGMTKNDVDALIETTRSRMLQALSEINAKVHRRE
jgi:lysophosphatidate acyltransferase